ITCAESVSRTVVEPHGMCQAVAARSTHGSNTEATAGQLDSSSDSSSGTETHACMTEAGWPVSPERASFRFLLCFPYATPVNTLAKKIAKTRITTFIFAMIAPLP
ncbi:MAG: hypothetical protein KGJ83_07935, partial [Betaproteobacteria bacterium]|nr:hypothetical protein [Betaproteobacteria bacterium]